MTDDDPHRGQPVLQAGKSPTEARAAMIMLHGRGADAADIIGIAQIIGADDMVYVAPEAARHTWYPYSFLAPVEQNEPGRSSALGVVAHLIASLETAEIAADRIALLGFSQGACLALEFAARHPRRYGAVFALSGLMLLVGCTHYKASPLSPTTSAADYERRSLTNSELRAFLETNSITGMTRSVLRR